MLRDITIASAKVNNVDIPCIRHKHKSPQKSKGDRKRVQFDADGMPPFCRVEKSHGGGKKTAEESESRHNYSEEDNESRGTSHWERFDMERGTTRSL
jgi:hypothetical protein